MGIYAQFMFNYCNGRAYNLYEETDSHITVNQFFSFFNEIF